MDASTWYGHQDLLNPEYRARRYKEVMDKLALFNDIKEHLEIIGVPLDPDSLVYGEWLRQEARRIYLGY